jgi:hypothetical protein
MARGQEARHVCPDFRQQRFRHAGAHPWDHLKEGDSVGEKRVGALLNLALNFRGRMGRRLPSVVVLASQFLEEEVVLSM